jgi:quinoprotein glucose dehydrogenase
MKWKRPIGTTPGLAAKRIIDTGSAAFMRNGPVVTAGGLISIGRGPDRMIHALDKDTGKTLWQTELEANPDGIPSVYQVNGREYIASYAAGSGAKESMFLEGGEAGCAGLLRICAATEPAIAGTATLRLIDLAWKCIGA